MIIPCLNEEKGIGFCLAEAIGVIQSSGLDAEIIVVDNSSSDQTAKIASDYSSKFENIILTTEKRRGYGSAYLNGLSVVTGKYILMADGDGTYDFSLIPVFLAKLESGFDLVVGNRFSSPNLKKNMPWLHRTIGNPVLSFLVRLFFGVKIKDVHCGLRAISKQALEKISLNTIGMEFASEMVIESAIKNLNVGEINIPYRERFGKSKLRTVSDGWRHLRFIFRTLYSRLK